MALSTLVALAIAVLGTSFLSGIFGMVGGLVLMGVLLAILPVPAAMTLHAVTQATANGWRALVWRHHIRWSVLPGYLVGAGVVFGLLAWVRFTPPKPWIYLFLGLLPWATRALPRAWIPDIRRRGAPVVVGALVTSLHLLAGVSGPVLDLFFLGPDLDRRAIVATKAMTQAVGHAIKFVYFSFVVAAPPTAAVEVPGWTYALCAALAVVGTSLARPVLDRFSNQRFLRWTRILVLGMGVVYLVQAARAWWP